MRDRVVALGGIDPVLHQMDRDSGRVSGCRPGLQRGTAPARGRREPGESRRGFNKTGNGGEPTRSESGGRRVHKKKFARARKILTRANQPLSPVHDLSDERLSGPRHFLNVDDRIAGTRRGKHDPDHKNSNFPVDFYRARPCPVDSSPRVASSRRDYPGSNR